MSQGIKFIGALDIFSDDGLCQIAVDSTGVYEPISFDYGHLTKVGSLLVSSRLFETTDNSFDHP